MHRIRCLQTSVDDNHQQRGGNKQPESGNIKHCYSPAGRKHLPTALSLSLILYWGWNTADISYSCFFTVQSPPHYSTGNTNLPSADVAESLLDILLDCC